MNIISRNDWRSVEAALERGETITLLRSLGGIRITVQVVEGSKIWEAPMLVSVEMLSHNKVQRQYFTTAEAARMAVSEWRP